jgi:nucleotide-binding universal stress UspA family protein
MERSGGTPQILVGVDGSAESTRALRWAADYARLCRAEIEAVTCWQYPTSYGLPAVLPDYDFPAETRQVLEDALTKAFGDQIPEGLRRRVEQSHPAVLLVAASAEADLLVVGSRGHGEFAGMLLGSVSEHCVTHAHCPVVVVRGERG